MKKLVILSRTNQKDEFYIKFRAEEKSMNTIKKIIEDLGSDYFEGDIEDKSYFPPFSKYERWKDQWIPIFTDKFKANIICGDKAIHLIFQCSEFRFINKILDKYCEWMPPVTG